MSIMDPVTLALVRSALDAGSMRQVAHASNVANAATPGYRPFKVVFEENLGEVRAALREGRKPALEHLRAAQMQLEAQPRDINLDTEVAAMSQGALHYQALSKALAREFALLGMAVSDGRR